ncbi:MAG: DUF4198 domain-containing protein [Pseudomonadota bacterium]
MIRIVLALFAIASSASVSAHSFWLEPETHTPDPGTDVNIDFRVGDIGKEAAEWGLYWERIAALRLFSQQATTDLQTAVRITAPDKPGGVTLVAPSAGTHTLAFASNPSFSDFEAKRFNRYLDHQGLTAIADFRAARGLKSENGTELYARRAKALFQIGDKTTDNILTPIGQTLEIVPLANPFGFTKPAPMTVAVLWRGEPLPGASLMVARGGGEKGTEKVVKTDQNGETNFEYHPEDRYLLSVVWGEPAPNDTRADFFTIFASLTF